VPKGADGEVEMIRALRATKFALRSVARRYRLLSEEISELSEHLDRLVAQAAPELVALEGVKTLRRPPPWWSLPVTTLSASRARRRLSPLPLCGLAPIPASSGKALRHRLNRQGNRDANRALYYVIAFSLMSWDERTRNYVARRIKEGKTKKEIIRCLKLWISYGWLRTTLFGGPDPASSWAESALVATRRSIPGVVP
jgi:transposase